jgi:hypothetical protein
MSPFIRDGDVITVAPFWPRGSSDARTCGSGQVVAFVNPASQRLVVHRIVGRHESSFLVQGDNLPEPAITAVDRDSVLGRVVRIERGGKRVWLGLGPERFAIAFLSRVGLLIPARTRAVALVRFVRKRRHDAAARDA